MYTQDVGRRDYIDKIVAWEVGNFYWEKLSEGSANSLIPAKKTVGKMQSKDSIRKQQF